MNVLPHLAFAELPTDALPLGSAGNRLLRLYPPALEWIAPGVTQMARGSTG